MDDAAVAQRVKELKAREQTRDEEAVARRVHELRAKETDRGRDADKPTQIPASGWKDILWRLKDEVGKDRVGTIAAGTTFFLLLAIFPALAALVSVYGLLADPMTIQGHLESLRGFLPGEMLTLLEDQLKRLATTQSSSLSVGFVSGLAIALWSANNGVKALFDALNVAYEEEEKRGFFKLNAVALAFTLGGIVFTVLLVNVVVGVPVVLQYLPLGPLGSVLVAVLPALILFGVATLFISMLYRFGPSRTRAQWRWVTPGSLAAALVWMIGSALFSWYLSNFADYSATYGSLGAAIGAMTWIYISMWIILLGAELNSEIEHQTARDTTVGGDKPLGARGAAMADRVAPRG
jgi:membrane protein